MLPLMLLLILPLLLLLVDLQQLRKNHHPNDKNNG